MLVIDPSGEDGASLTEGEEQRLVEKLVAHATVEALDEPVLRRLAWRDVVPAAIDAHTAGASLTALAASFDELLAEPLRVNTLRRLA